jgi:hypothetical protein
MVMKQRCGTLVLMGAFLFFFGLPALYAQDEEMPLALVPFWGSNQNIISQFDQVLQKALLDDGAYRPEVVDMKNLPPDVPEGGFPPYICPSPSLIGGAPYALTGEVVSDEDNGFHRVRLYLWEMRHTTLLNTDDITVRDRDEFAHYLPFLLEWFFGRPDEGYLTAGQAPRSSRGLTAEGAWPDEGEDSEVLWRNTNNEDNLLYAGLRIGSSARFYNRPHAKPFVENDIHHYINLEAALHVTCYFLPFLGIQGEAVFTTDYAPFKTYRITGGDSPSLAMYEAPFTSFSLMFPLLLKYTYRKDFFAISPMAGAYFALPLGEMQNEQIKGEFSVNPPLGYVLGINLGRKAGPGTLFLDLRWAADIGETVNASSGEFIYKRSMLSIAVGYEMGFFPQYR